MLRAYTWRLCPKYADCLWIREVGFLVCSNEPLASAFYSTANIHLGHNHLVEDLYSFARCDYLIGPPSTYTMWASYYGGVPLCLITHPGIDPALENFELVLPSERQHARLLENIRLVEGVSFPKPAKPEPNRLK